MKRLASFLAEPDAKTIQIEDAASGQSFRLQATEGQARNIDIRAARRCRLLERSLPPSAQANSQPFAADLIGLYLATVVVALVTCAPLGTFDTQLGPFLDNLIRRPLLFFIRMNHKFLTVGAHS